jgi:hypothetical protein
MFLLTVMISAIYVPVCVIWFIKPLWFLQLDRRGSEHWLVLTTEMPKGSFLVWNKHYPSCDFVMLLATFLQSSIGISANSFYGHESLIAIFESSCHVNFISKMKSICLCCSKFLYCCTYIMLNIEYHISIV